MKNRYRKWIACMLSVFLLVAIGTPAFAADDGVILCADVHEAAVVLREEMVKRQAAITVAFPGENENAQLVNAILNEALAHTGVPVQGDYLRFGIRKCTVVPELLEYQGESLVKLTYNMVYYTTAEQEERLNAAVEDLLFQLDVYNAGEYEKVCAIYNYICENVSYDSWGVASGDKMIYTAYAALMYKWAVCQGYATLFYRLALELGLDARVISGTSRNQSHGWNIVRLGDRYYNVDSTWDAEQAQSKLPYQFFLCSEEGFGEHTRKASYCTEAFMEQHPMAQENFDASDIVISGELTGDGQVDEEDAIYLLQHVLMPESFPL